MCDSQLNHFAAYQKLTQHYKSTKCVCVCVCESCSVMPNSLRSHGLYSPWNSPGQNTGVGSLFLLQGIFPTQESNPGLLHCRRILYQLNHREAHTSIKKHNLKLIQTNKIYNKLPLKY